MKNNKVIRKLITFGCSNTYGESLSDIWDYKKNIPIRHTGPSKYAWPQLLANKLNLECVNLGNPGASNKEIWYTILHQEYIKNDIVIILWTYLNRFCFLSENMDRIKLLLPAEPNAVGMRWPTYSKIYYKYFYNEYDLLIDFYLRANHVQSYLQNKVKLVKHYIQGVDEYEPKPIWNNVEFFDEWKHIDNDPRAEDGTHPGIEKHKTFSEVIYNEIIDLI
jgi:hypothetical protein